MKSKSILLPKMLVLVLLESVYTLGFIITPYWTHVPSKTESIFILALTIGIGAIWSLLSAGNLRIELEPIKWGHIIILFTGLVILNLRPLSSSIPWRGDEELHITRTVYLLSTMSFKWVVIFLVAFVILAYLTWKKSRWAIFLGMALIASVIAAYLMKSPLVEMDPSQLLHYPYINYWFFTIIPKLAMVMKINPYQEVFFRIVPFISTFALIWVFQKHLSGSKTFLNVLWGLAAATIPLVYYYSSILYLELPAVFLMLLVCINIKSLLQEDFQKIKQNPAWYALILIGFIKETTVPFLMCFLGWRIIASLSRKRISPITMKRRFQILLEEAGIILPVILPIFFYLFLRSSLAQESRTYSFTISNLANSVVYRTIARSFLEQFGAPFLLLFGGGCLLLFWENEYLTAGFFLSLFMLYPLFFASDIFIYTGYSRFNLFVLPPVLAGAIILINRLTNYRKILEGAVVCAVLALNLWISPVFIDGSKKPLWGNYLADTSEHYYPYREALDWLKNNDSDKRILFTGMYYPYDFDFYFTQLNWTPNNKVFKTNRGDSDSVSLSRALIEAEQDKIDVILFQVLGNSLPKVMDMGHFSEVQIFKTDAQTLIVYER
jgi:hypothetical protein